MSGPRNHARGIARTEEQKKWEAFSRQAGAELHIDTMLGQYKADEFFRLVDAWLPELAGRRILKTDLSEEAFGDDHILFSPRLRASVVSALDISCYTASTAARRPAPARTARAYACGDVRQLPFISGVFDVIFSTSTLDHFYTEEDFLEAVRELRRVTKDGGSMILTINNRLNPNYYAMITFSKLIGISKYPVQFYAPAQLKQLLAACGWEVQRQEFIVHIISPVNTLLRAARKIFPAAIVGRLSRCVVMFARWLGACPCTRWLTGWFIAVKCCAVRSPPSMSASRTAPGGDTRA